MPQGTTTWSFAATDYESYSTPGDILVRRPEAGMRSERHYAGAVALPYPNIDPDTNMLHWGATWPVAGDSISAVVVGTDAKTPTLFRPPMVVLCSFWKPVTMPSGMYVGFGARKPDSGSWATMRPGLGTTLTAVTDRNAGVSIHASGTYPDGAFLFLVKPRTRQSSSTDYLPQGPPEIQGDPTELFSRWTGGFYVGPSATYALRPSIGRPGPIHRLQFVTRSGYEFEHRGLGLEVWAGVWTSNALALTTGAFYLESLTVVELATPIEGAQF